MARWNLPDVPHKGWILVDCVDLGASVFDSNNIRYETCEMCHNEKIRYIHILKHPLYPNEIHVGCVCACKLTEDYVKPREIEKELQNRYLRRSNFLKQKWIRNINGNLILNYKGERITAIERNGSYGFVFKDVWVWDFQGRRISDLDTLKLAAFNVFDNR